MVASKLPPGPRGLPFVGNLLPATFDLLGFLTDSARLASEIGDRRNIARSRLLLAGLATLQGEFGTARQWYEEGLSTALEIGHTNHIASGLKGLGCVAAAQGLPTWAAVLWGTAEPLRESEKGSRPGPKTHRHLDVPGSHAANRIHRQ